MSVVQGVALLTLKMTVERGTAARGRAVVQQVPEAWTTADGGPAPAPGDLLRLVNCRLSDTAGPEALLRADRLATALWTVASEATSSAVAPATEEDG
jgi:hypothetical protein